MPVLSLAHFVPGVNDTILILRVGWSLFGSWQAFRRVAYLCWCTVCGSEGDRFFIALVGTYCCGFVTLVHRWGAIQKWCAMASKLERNIAGRLLLNYPGLCSLVIRLTVLTLPGVHEPKFSERTTSFFTRFFLVPHTNS